MRCLFGLLGVVTAIVVLILFDWLNAREIALDTLSMLQHWVEVLSDWGDKLQEAMGLSHDAASDMHKVVEKAKAAVEKISD